MPNERSSHTIPTPHGGGIAIVVTWIIGLTYFFMRDSLPTNLYIALMLGVLISIVSFFDDIYELSAKLRLIVQGLIAILGILVIGGLNNINLIFFSIDNQIVTNLFAFFLIIWFINLYNFLDGIDGYAGSQSIFLGIAGYFIFGGEHFLVLVVASLGFLVFNWHKAKIFMGDVGSTMLGYTIAIFTLYYQNNSSEDISGLLVWILLFSLYWVDATLTLYRRFKTKNKLTEAHKEHFYQRLNQSGWKHDQVVLGAMTINLVILGQIILFKNIGISIFINLILIYFIIKYIDKKKAFNC
jgi:Fuc2NAc and GlcNAc transferase